jgi:hypothetical protein
MADGEKKKKSLDTSEERFKYIGFDVFPGKAGDLFKSDDEQQSLIEKVRHRFSKSSGEVRERCTLMESRVSPLEKIFLTLAAVVMVLGLFIPWFSGYIPVSYAELGSFGDNTFFYASQGDERAVNDLANALKKKHDRRFGSIALTDESEQPLVPAENEMIPDVNAVEADPNAVEESTGELVTETAGEREEVSTETDPEAVETEAPPSPETEQAELQPETGGGEFDNDQISEVIKAIFVDFAVIDDIHGLNDLREHAVAYYTYNARTGQENIVYGSANVMRALPEEITTYARTNDSISAAITDSLRQAVSENIAAGDSSISLDSVFFAGPVLVTNKPLSELAMKGIVNDYYSMTGIGAILSIGTYGSMVFSSGIVLIATGLMLIIYFLSCLVLAAVNLFILYGSKKKGSGDELALHLKRILRYNWIPVLLWLAMFTLSFFGASYGFDSAGMLKQVGGSYGLATFIGLSSFGVYVTLAAFLIVALKGKEI